MALVQAAWIHGHAMEIEFPDRIARETRTGFSLRVEGRAGSENWVHCAIPTPVIVREQRLKAGQVLLRYRAAGGALIHAVHIYDGETRIGDYNGLNNESADWMTERHDVSGDPQVSWGVGISVGVRFPHAGGHIEFASAGCDFVGEAIRPPVVVTGR